MKKWSGKKVLRKESVQKELKPYHREFSVARAFLKGLAKSLLLVGSDKHQTPSAVDFGLQNTICLGASKWSDFDSIEFVDCSPVVFQKLRHADGISSREYVSEMGVGNFQALFSSRRETLKHEQSTGQSGAFFFVSPNGKYFVKKIRQKEAQLLKKMLRPYFLHLQENSSSLLSRFYGLHQLRFFEKGKARQTLHFVVMNNLFFDGVGPISPQKIFDLKGSSFKRKTTPDLLRKGAAGKDLDFEDFLLLNSHKFTSQVPKLRKVLQILKSDSEFLARQNVMDYRWGYR